MFDFSGKPAATPDWAAMTQQYLEALRQFAPAAAAPNPFAQAWPGMAAPAHPFAGTPAGNPFAGMNPFAAAGNPFEAMARQAAEFAKPDAGKHADVAERAMDSLKNYFSMIQALASAGMPASGGGDAASSHPWSAAAANWNEAMQAGYAGAANPLDNPLMRSFREFGGSGAQGFEQMMGQFMAAPGMADARAMLQLPTFGMSREHQEKAQQGVMALLDYQEKSQRYQALIAKAWQRGNQLFQTKLAARGESDKPIETPRALYDLWVDAAEEGYAEIALSAEFSQAYGDYVNAQMALRSHVQKEAERTASQLGMPTRSEVNSIGQRLQELRREVRAAREAGTVEALAAEVARLGDEVAALRAENAALRATTRKSALDAPAPRVDRGGSLREEVRTLKQPATKRASKRAPKATHRQPDAGTVVRGKAKAKAGSIDSRSFAASIARFAEAAKSATRVDKKAAEKPSDKSSTKRAGKS